jgi:hypothetical protein
LNIKRILIVVGVALAVYLLVTNPTGAAGIVSGIINILKDAAEAVSTFVHTVFNV